MTIDQGDLQHFISLQICFVETCIYTLLPCSDIFIAKTYVTILRKGQTLCVENTGEYHKGKRTVNA